MAVPTALFREALKRVRSTKVEPPPRKTVDGALDPLIMDAEEMLRKAEADPMPPTGDPAADVPRVTPDGDAPPADVEPAPAAPVAAADPLVQMQTKIDAAETNESLDEIAPSLVGRELNEFDLTERYQVNFDRIDGDEDLQAVLAELAERNKAQIERSRRGVMADEHVARLARDANVQEQSVRALMTRGNGDATLNAEMVMAARQVLNSSAVRLHQLATAITRGDATDRHKMDFRRQVEFHNALQAQFMGARAEIGRALRAFRPVAYMTDDDVAERSVLINTSELRSIDRMAQNVVTAGGRVSENGVGPGKLDVARITKAAKKPLPWRLTGAFEEFFMGSILSGPKTWLVNFVGSPLMQGMEIAELAVAARINQGENAVRRAIGRDQVAGVEIGEATATMHGFLSGVFDGLRMARESFITGQPSVNSFVKYEMPGAPAISSEMFNLAGPLGWFSKGLEEAVRPVANAAVDFTGSVARSSMERIIQPSDEFWKALAYRGDLGRSAVRQALTERRLGTLDDVKFADRVQELMEMPDPRMIDQAQSTAIHITFQQELGDTGRAVQSALSRIPLFRIVSPFIKTPTNIFKEGIRRTPLGAMEPAMNPEIMADPVQRQKWLARVGVGSGTSALVAAMTSQGHVTGAGPPDWQAQDALRATGWRPYSIYDGKRYHSYMRGEPWSFAVGTVATMSEAIMRSDYSDPSSEIDDLVFESSLVVIQGIGGSFMDKTFVSGISDFMLAASEPGMYAESWLKRTATGSIPFSSWRRQVSRMSDPYLREAFTLSEKIATMPWLPGSTSKLPYKLDVLGQPKVYDTGMLGSASPFPVVMEKDNPVHQEIRRLYSTTYQGALTMPSRRIQGLQLSAEQYYRMVLMSRQEIEIGGRSFNDALQDLVNHREYRNPASPLIDEGRIQLWRDLQRRYDSAARERLVAEDPILRQQMSERDTMFRETGLK